MARMLAFMLVTALLLGGCVFGRADGTPEPVTSAPPATDQVTPAAPADDAEAPGDVVARSPESALAPDPFTRLDDRLTAEAEIRTLLARWMELTAEALSSGPGDTDESEELWDLHRAWLETAVNELGSTVRDLELEAATAPPALADYAGALHDWALALLRHWRASLGEGSVDATLSAWNDAADRLTTARERALLEALPAGSASHGYIASFSEHLTGDWAPPEPDVGETVPELHDAWIVSLTALESEQAKWAAIAPPSGWADFHSQWSDLLANVIEALRQGDPARLQTATQAQVVSAVGAFARAVSPREKLVAEWIMIAAAEVAAAHPLSGSDEEPTPS